MAHRPLSTSASAPLLGRSRERAALDGLLEQVRGGHSGVLVLRGEAGIGKTALLGYVVSAATGFAVARCAGVESEMELPFAQLHELCAPLTGGLDALPEPQRHALSVALGLETGKSPDKLLVALATLGLLAAASERGPMLCVVEDAHWLDQASAQIVGFVGRRLLAEPVGVVCAARAPVAAPDHLMGLPELRIEGLDDLSSRALLGSVSAGRVDDRVRARIVDETQGNPLALLELGARMGAAGFAGGFATVDEVSLSDRIEDEYLTRLSTLPEDTQQLVLLAAADSVGDTALIQRAAKRLGLGVDAARAAIDTGLLSVGASMRFRHPLLRSAVYRTVSIERRRQAHGALAAVTDANVDPDRRAWHRAYAASAPDEDVAAELIGSADRAQGRGGAAAAAAFWERAVAVTPDPAVRASRALVAAQTKYEAGDFDATHRLLAEASSGPLTELEHVKVDLIRAQVAVVYRGRDAPALLLKAATRLETINGDLARETYLQALIASSYAGRLGDPDVRREIARAAQALPLDPAPTPSMQMLVHGFATWMADGYVAAAPTLKEAVRQYRNESHDPGLVGFGYNVMAMHLCDDEAWYALSTDQVDLARKTGMLSALPFALDSLTEFYVQAGQLAKAEAAQMEADRIHPAVTAARSPRTAVLAAAWRGDASVVHGSVPQLTEGALTTGEGWKLAYVEYAKAVLYNGIANYASAADAAENASADIDFVAGFPWRALYELAEGAARSDQLERANAAVKRLTVIALASGSEVARAMAARSAALTAEDDAADELYREAIERFSHTRATIHLARARLVYGEWLRRQNRRADARTQLRSAHEALAAMGAYGFAQRAQRELQATGEKVRRRTSSPASAELTAQEQQIAQFARERRTNSEIGAQLFLSARTVEWHLGNIFAKLKITSRRELDAALARHPAHVQDV
jgi:DNA-binding CsgD family transcriptional regulator